MITFEEIGQYSSNYKNGPIKEESNSQSLPTNASHLTLTCDNLIRSTPDIARSPSLCSTHTNYDSDADEEILSVVSSNPSPLGNSQVNVVLGSFNDDPNGINAQQQNQRRESSRLIKQHSSSHVNNMEDAQILSNSSIDQH